MNNTAKLSASKKQLLFAGMQSLLSAGLDFSTSFSLLIESEQNSKLKNLLSSLYQSVLSGSSLWEAMQSSGCFSSLDAGVVRIGEQTGKINEALEFLSDYYRKRMEQQRMVTSAVSYPIVILCTAFVVVTFMVLVIVPMFEQVYSRMGSELPALTRSIISLSKDFPNYILVFVLLAGAVLLFFLLWGKKPEIRMAWACCLLRLPLIGKILRKNEQAQFCRLLYLLLVSGVPLIRGLEMLLQIITLRPYQASIEDFCRSLKHGELLYTNMERHSWLYEMKFITLVRVGEETHRLPQMLKRQGDELTQELEYSLKQLGTMLEPILILFVGVLVAVVMVSMYLPMFKLGGVIG